MNKAAASSFLFLIFGPAVSVTFAASSNLVGTYRLRRFLDEDKEEIEIPSKTTLLMSLKGDSASNNTSEQIYTFKLAVRHGNRIIGTATVHPDDDGATVMEDMRMTRMKTDYLDYESQLYGILSWVDTAKLRRGKVLELDGHVGKFEFRKVPSRAPANATAGP
jgi:hypothetical protein